MLGPSRVGSDRGPPGFGSLSRGDSSVWGGGPGRRDGDQGRGSPEGLAALFPVARERGRGLSRLLSAGSLALSRFPVRSFGDASRILSPWGRPLLVPVSSLSSELLPAIDRHRRRAGRVSVRVRRSRVAGPRGCRESPPRIRRPGRHRGGTSVRVYEEAQRSDFIFIC